MILAVAEGSDGVRHAASLEWAPYRFLASPAFTCFCLLIDLSTDYAVLLLRSLAFPLRSGSQVAFELWKLRLDVTPVL